MSQRGSDETLIQISIEGMTGDSEIVISSKANDESMLMNPAGL